MISPLTNNVPHADLFFPVSIDLSADFLPIVRGFCPLIKLALMAFGTC